MSIWVGEITAPIEAKPILEGMQIELGLRINETWYGCRVPDTSLDALDPHWGNWIWHLAPTASREGEQ